MPNVLIFEDNKNFAEGVQNILDLSEGFGCVGNFIHPVEAVSQIENLKPDVVLMDIEMPEKTGIEAVQEIRESGIQTPILMLTVFEDDDSIMQSINVGADGYLLKESKPQKLLDAIKDVLDGGAPMTAYVARRVLKLFSAKEKEKTQPQKENYNLSEREKEILSTLCEGMSYKMIAAKLSLSYHTVNTHIKKIYDKLHVHSSVEAVTKAARERLV
jgi:DNA-binding NarL/FixJ family response regulator